MTDKESMRAPLPRFIGRLGLYATVMAAVLFTLVIVGDLNVLIRRVPAVGWLAILLGTGPLIALLLSTCASYINYYGVWRIARGQEEYDAGEDLKSHAADVPQAVQGLLASRGGCLPLVSTALLFLSLLLATASSVPPQTPFVGALDTWSGNPSTQALAAIPTPTATLTSLATVTPTATASKSTSPAATATKSTSPGTAPATPTPVPEVIKFSISPTLAYWNCHNQGQEPAPQMVTLDNRKSTVAVSWHASVSEKDRGGDLWAAISPRSGTVAAGSVQTITVSPDPSDASNVCFSSSAGGTPWHVSIATATAGTHTFTYTISYYLT